MQQRQQFGGDWTEEKLARIEKYLGAYTKILSKQPFRFAYIDAFAGTGYRQLKQENNPAELMFPELAGVDSQKFLEVPPKLHLESAQNSLNTSSSRRIFVGLPNWRD